LADVIYAQERFEEAEQYTRISEASAAPADCASQILWRSVRAKVLARAGRLADAEQLAREAVARADGTDNIVARGDALMALAEVLRFAARPEEVVPVIQNALGLYERKGNRVLAAKARLELGELTK
jgi:tetratricopeptide (TPR) repeat protein